MPTLLVLLHSPILCPTRLSSAKLEEEFLGFCGSGSNYPWELSSSGPQKGLLPCSLEWRYGCVHFRDSGMQDSALP